MDFDSFVPVEKSLWRPKRLSALAVVFTLSCAQAGAYGLRTHERAVAAPAGQEDRQDSGWLTAGPVIGHAYEATTNNGTDVHTTMDNRADYGVLSGSFDAYAHNSGSSGAFAWADSWIGGQPHAEYIDHLTITSSTLAAGTPVQVRLTASLWGGYSTSIAGNPDNLSADASLEGMLNWSSSSANGSLDVKTASDGTDVRFVSTIATTTVGGSLDLDGKFWNYAHAYANSYGAAAQAQATGSGGFVTGIDVLTAGAYYTADSSHVYAVPEPATLGALALGCAVFYRQRKRR